MQRSPKLTTSVIIGAIVCLCLQLWNFASGWQPSEKPEDAAATSPEKPTVEAPQASEEATTYFQQARERLARWKSIQTRVVQRIDLGDRRFTATGKFTAGEFPRMRLEYQVQVGSTTGHLLEVCDGQVLHIERRISDEKTEAEAAKGDQSSEMAGSKTITDATRRDIQRVLRTTEAAETDAAALMANPAGLSLGGLPALLASLERSMILTGIRQEEFEGRTFSVVQGTWKPDYLANLQARMGSGFSQLAGFLPDRVRVYFDSESLFPVRILYLKRSAPESRKFRAMLSLEFHDVEFNAELSPALFSYQVPTGVQQKDDTDEFIQLLKLSLAPVPVQVEAEAESREPGRLNLQPRAMKRD